MNRRKYLLDVPVDLYQPDEFLLMIENAICTSSIKTVLAVNPEKIISAQKDHGLLLSLKGSDFLIPDGIGTVLGIKFIHGISIRRTTGFLLMQNLLKLAEAKRFKVFIFGATCAVNEVASENIKKLYPSLAIVGTQHGYISEKENEAFIERINHSNPDILFVGLGSPKQEKWIHKYSKKLAVKICMGVGGSLDVIAGRIPGASSFVHKLGLEWLYRLIIEPSRLKRQLALPRYSLALIKEKISHI